MIWDKSKGLGVNEKDIQHAIEEHDNDYNEMVDNLGSYQLTVARGITTFNDLMLYIRSKYITEVNNKITRLSAGMYYQTYGDELIIYVDIGSYGHHLFRWEYTITFPWNSDNVKVFTPHYPDADIIINEFDTDEEPVEVYDIDDVIPDWIFEDVRHI